MKARTFALMVVLWLLFLAFAIELFLRAYVIPIPNSEPHRIYSLYKKDLTALALGDSHIRRGFIASDDFLNLGLGGTTIPAQFYISKFILQKQVPERVILEAAPQFFAEINLERGSMNYESYLKSKSFYPWFFEPGITQYLNHIKSWKDFGDLLEKRWIDELNRDSMWPKYTQAVRREKTFKRVLRHTPQWSNAKAHKYAQIYEEMLKGYLAKGANVCILRTPVDENYLALIENNQEFQSAYSYFRSLAQKYGVKYVDFRDMGMKFTIEKFLNQDHLAPQYSREFSRKVRDLCFEGSK